MAVIKEGLITRNQLNWGADELVERLDHIRVHDVPWDEVYFSGNASAHWRQRGTYEDDKWFRGHGVHWLTDNPDEEPSPKMGYHVHVEGVGFFLDLDDYYRFLRVYMRSTVTEEIWEDR
jgi:hypothetical protein